MKQAISLFSGMGGDTVGIHNAGWNVIGFSEKESVFQKTHLTNFPECTLLGSEVKGDIIKTPDKSFLHYQNRPDNPHAVQLIFAGFPCQAFSNAGKKKRNDPRNTLFREFVRATRLIQPDIIIGENVQGLLTKQTTDNEPYIDVIETEFKNLGYHVIHQVFKCEQYGVPQKRRRLLILGIHSSQLSNYYLSFPPPTTPIPPTLESIVSFTMDGTYPIELPEITIPSINDEPAEIPESCIITDETNESEGGTEDESVASPHKYIVLKSIIPDKSYSGKTYDTLFSFGKRISPIHCEIIDVRKPTKTIICTYSRQPRLLVLQKNAVGYFIRSLSVQELQQIQGFPKEYHVCGNQTQQIIQIGNAAPPPLIESVVRHVCRKESATLP